MKSVIACALLLISGPALAQQRCADYATVERGLSALGEQLIATANHPAGGIEFWAHPETGSFTIVGRPNTAPEQGCLVMDGTDLRPSKGIKLPKGREV